MLDGETPLQNFPLFITYNLLNSKVVLNVQYTFLPIEQTYIVTPNLLQFTDSNGIATFSKITVIDAKDTGCVNFMFAYGDQGYLYNQESQIRSSQPTSNTYCFKNQQFVTIA